ncbi:peptidoglycan DD-metalloendopeptidase family protein [Halobacillus mangrovi]|uniref:M23 family metallopeptidase n=1 Tax=Halobacillus mangrovi TaxID=402384 RepID=UPI003D98152D
MFRSKGIGKKVAATALIGLSLSVGTAYAENSFKTTYHVFVDGKRVGIVENEEVVKNYVENRVESAENKHGNWDMVVEEDVSFESEKMFAPDFKNDKVIQSLEEEITVAASAVDLQIDGETAAFLPSEEQADEVIRQLKEKYVDAETLTKLEEASSKGKTEKSGDNKYAITDVQLSEKVTKKPTKVQPSDMATVEEAVAKIEEGETSVRYEMSQDHLMNANGEEQEQPDSEDVEKTTEKDPMLDVIVKEQGTKTETISHEKEVRETDELYKGDTKVKQNGEDGERTIHFTKKIVNGELDKKEVTKEEVTKEPVKEIILKGTKVVPSRGTGNFEWPAVGGQITSKMGQRWGRMHKGIDIAGVSDRTIKAADNGKVVTAERQSGFGNKIVIDHNNGYKTIYAHLSSFDVSVGDVVKKGESIGTMGNTGNSTGIHLHFEVHKDGSLKNPLSFF